MYFPAPPKPAFPADQASVFEGHLRYEDVGQDGRMIPIAIPTNLGGLWRTALLRHPGARATTATGIIPILTRMTIASAEQHVRVDRPIESHAGFEIARDAAGDRLFMNIWLKVHGASGRIVPREPAGPLVLAGQVFAEHTFTRPFGPPEQRRVTRLGHGYPEVPDLLYPARPPSSAGDAPDGATWLDELAPDPVESVLGLDQTDSNQHVNSLVYIRLFLDAAQRRLAAGGHSLAVRSREVDIAYRKPSFAGERVRPVVRLFTVDNLVGAAGFIAPIGQGDDKPRCYVRAIFGP